MFENKFDIYIRSFSFISPTNILIGGFYPYMYTFDMNIKKLILKHDLRYDITSITRYNDNLYITDGCGFIYKYDCMQKTLVLVKESSNWHRNACMCNNNLITCDNTKVLLWDITSWKPRQLFKGVDWMCSVTSNDNIIMSGCEDGRIRYHTNQDPIVKSIQAHKSNVTDLICHGNKLYSTSFDSTLKCWDIETGLLDYTIPDANGNKFVIDSEKESLYLGCINGELKRIDIKAKKVIFTTKLHSGLINCIRFEPVSKSIWTSTKDCLKEFKN